MRKVSEHLKAQGAIDVERWDNVEEELTRLERFSLEPVPVRDILVTGELSPRSFMALMANTFVRVFPTYAEIPLNLALHGARGDLRNYGLIALNVNDEAGEGEPLRTHPALFNRSAEALSTVFGVPSISVRIGLAALTLRLNDCRGDRRDEELGLVRGVLLQDEFGERVAAEQLLSDFDIVCEYSPLIAEEALECYRWRMQTLADIVGTQLCDGLSHDGYLELLSLLAVREAAASDPGNIFHALSRMVVRYAGYFGADIKMVAEALCWSDVHIDEKLGMEAGYEGHSVEDDHAEQALGAVLDHLQDDHDLLLSLCAMNTVNRHLRDLWEGTVRVMGEQKDEKVVVKAIRPEVHQRVRKERSKGLVP